jgi:hypothetical protein
MPTWEYLLVVADFGNHSFRPRLVNGIELPRWEEGPTIDEYSDQMVKEGWELVEATFATASPGGIMPRLSFKRAVPDA